MKYQEIYQQDINGYTYLSVTNDDNKVRIYTLKNGLKVFLAQNFDAPKIQTYIPVKTGSNRDPEDNTGLAHYLEHMMFKGSTRLGTINWEQEKILLEQISELFEQHKYESDLHQKKEIYKEIDRLSLLASEYAIANEYDKAVSSLGATGTNAHTWLNETVYKNNIPKNELEKWLKIESDRFSGVVLRLFHTELESVYEEFNRLQDNDSRVVNYAMMELLFPTHPNGQQTTIGRAEHLKNPSMKAINEYFNNYYVPNNYAIVLVGDLDFEQTILLIDKYFGKFQYKEIVEKPKIVEKPITEVVSKVIESPSTPRVHLGWRTDSYGTRECILIDIIAHILSNRGEAGLMDLNVNQQQKVLASQAYSVGFKEYGYLSVIAIPKEYDSLEYAKNLILEQIDLVKKGEFPDWLISAIVNDFRFQRLKALETADGLASNLYDVFIKERTWKEELQELDIYAQVTKDEVVGFANEFFKNNYVVIYKEQGDKENSIRVDKPEISPIKINRDAQSEFLEEILNEEPERITPEFIDYESKIQTSTISDRKYSFVENQHNDIAQVHFIFPIGRDNDKEQVLAIQYLEYLGTNQFSVQEIKQKFYKIGVTYYFKISDEEINIYLVGLEENISEGIDLLFHWLENAKPDKEIYSEFVEMILDSREAVKKDKNQIMKGLINYAKFGEKSSFRNVIPEDRLLSINPMDLTDKLRFLLRLDYEIFYYAKDKDKFTSFIAGYIHPITEKSPNKEKFSKQDTDGNVYFFPYDMVQVEMYRVGKGNIVEPENYGKISVFNEYFGSGLSSVVFQEVRESKSLAYQAYAMYSSANKKKENDYIANYIGTQPDKLAIAVDTMENLMREFPKYPIQFENAKQSVLKKMESVRVTRAEIFFQYKRQQKLGINYNLRKKAYEQIKNLTIDDLEAFYNQYIKNQTYNTAIMGKENSFDTQLIMKLGTFEKISVEKIFNY